MISKKFFFFVIVVAVIVIIIITGHRIKKDNNNKKNKIDLVYVGCPLLLFCVMLAIFLLPFLFFLFQDILCKVKTLLIDEKKHLRFGDWNANDVSIINYPYGLTHFAKDFWSSKVVIMCQNLKKIKFGFLRCFKKF